MKKKYEKPTVVYESFRMSQSIAADCGVNINSDKVDVCEVIKVIAGSQVDGLLGTGGFTAQNGECSSYISDYCYTNGSSFVVVHAS